MDGQNKIMIENISSAGGGNLVIVGKVIEGTILTDMKCFDIFGKETRVKEIRNLNQPNADYLKYGQRGKILIEGATEEDVKGKEILAFI